MAFKGKEIKWEVSGNTGNSMECKPDYEAQAASLYKKLDSTCALEEALFNFSDRNSIYPFHEISSFAEMLGGVMMIKHEQTRHYESLLKKMEK